MRPVTTAAPSLLLLIIISQTSCLIEVKNYEFKKNEVFRGNHTKSPDNKVIMFSKSKGTIYSTSLSQLPDDIDDLWFDNSNFDQIEDGSLCSSPGITEVTFYWNNLPKLTGGVFANCVNLTAIIYDRNTVVNSTRKFADDVFAGLPGLKTLVVRGGRNIPNVPKTLFKGLNSLRLLRIHWTDLATVESEAFDDLIHLKILDLHENRLATLDKALFSKLSELEELDLSRNSLKNLDGGLLANLQNLEILDISRNQLESFPWNDLVGLTKLRKLDFRNNKVKNLTAEVDLVETLKNHWPSLEDLQYQQESMSCEEVLATTTAIWKFREYLEMPYHRCGN